MPFSYSIAKNAGFVSRLHLTGLSVFSGALTGRLRAVALVFACLLGGLVPDQLHAQTLSFLNNYFVSGDHIVRDFVPYSGQPTNGFVNGWISVPDRNHDLEGVPDGAEVVAAFLYWQVLEPMSPPSPDPGSSALFNGYSIAGDVVGSDQSACGSGTALVRSYRANVLPYLPVNANGSSQAATTHTAGLPVNPNGSPSLPGASLVIVYRVLSGAPWPPLKATVIYDGSLEVSGPFSGSNNLLMGGFYDAVPNSSDIAYAKVTDIYGTVSSAPSFVSFFHHTSAQGVGDHASTVTEFNSFSLSASQCAAFTTTVFTTRVYSGDGDGLLDAWKTNQGYCDFGVNQGTCGGSGSGDPSWVPLPGATPGEKDIFVQVDYMYAGDHSHEPRGTALSMVTSAFSKATVNVHFLAGNAIPEDTCADDTSQTPPLLCMFPGEPGVVAWKLGLEAFKAWPTNLNTNTNTCIGPGGVCTPRFQPGRKDSYHYLLIGHSLALPTWSVADPIYTLKSIQVSNGDATVTTSATLTSCPSRVTIDGAITTPNLNGVYTTITCPSPLNTTFTISNINVNTTPPYTVADGPYPNTLAEPYLAVYTSVTDSTSGYSDIGGGDIAVTLGKWTWEKGLPAENFIGGECFTSDIDVSPECENGLAGTVMHELGHNLTLLHGGRFYPNGSTTPETQPNCKPQYQSVMNYLFQVDLLSDAQGDRVPDYSWQGYLTKLDENNLSTTPGITPPLLYPSTKWFAPSYPQSISNPPSNPPQSASSHCDGTPKGSNETAYEMEGPADPIAWSNGWDINFDGILGVFGGEGDDDWGTMDPRQIGASGNDNVSGAISTTQPPFNGAYMLGSYVFGPNGGLRAGGGGGLRAGGGGGLRAGGGGGLRAGGGGGLRAGGGGGLRAGGGGGVGEPNYNTIDSYPRPPRAVTASGGPVAWKPATFGNIVQYNVYRVKGLSSTLIACVYVGTPPVPSGCVPGDPYATSYSYSDNGAPANSTYLVTTVDLDPVSNLPRESTPQGSGAAQALLNLNVTTPLTYGSPETLTTIGGSTGGAVIFYLLSGPCSVSGTQLTANSGTGSCSVAATMAGDSAYNPVTSPTVTVSLAKAPLTITANHASKFLGAANPTFSAMYSGFVNGEGPGVLTDTLNCRSTAVTNSPVGTYPIECSGQSSPNYAITYVPGTLTILYVNTGMCYGDIGHQILQPVNADGTSTFKQGSTVPAKFRVCDVNGVSIGTPGVVSSFKLVKVITNTVVQTVDEAAYSSTPDTVFRWDSTAQQWIFNISTKSLATHATYMYSIGLNDGSSIPFQFGLPK